MDPASACHTRSPLSSRPQRQIVAACLSAEAGGVAGGTGKTWLVITTYEVRRTDGGSRTTRCKDPDGNPALECPGVLPRLVPIAGVKGKETSALPEL